MIARRLLAPPPGWRRDADVVVVGSGVAGVTTVLAIRRALPAARIVLATKSVLDDGSTRWAQGGIAAALGPGDSPVIAGELEAPDFGNCSRGFEVPEVESRPDGVDSRLTNVVAGEATGLVTGNAEPFFRVASSLARPCESGAGETPG